MAKNGSRGKFIAVLAACSFFLGPLNGYADSSKRFYIEAPILGEPYHNLLVETEPVLPENIITDRAVTLEFGWDADFTTLNQPDPAIIQGP